jgi:hypothetical protein
LRGDQHPDPLVEIIRQQSCEAELTQAFGRVRGVNRTARDPVQIDVLTSAQLPVVADESLLWNQGTAGLGGWIETAVEGVVILDSPADSVRLFPNVWANEKAAKREPPPSDFRDTSLYNNSLKGFVPEIPTSRFVTYRPAGRGQQTRRAWFDLALIPDPRAWLEARLGALPSCEVSGAAADTGVGDDVSGYWSAQASMAEKR